MLQLLQYALIVDIVCRQLPLRGEAWDMEHQWFPRSYCVSCEATSSISIDLTRFQLRHVSERGGLQQLLSFFLTACLVVDGLNSKALARQPFLSTLLTRHRPGFIAWFFISENKRFHYSGNRRSNVSHVQIYLKERGGWGLKAHLNIPPYDLIPIVTDL